ncbi:MAG: rRNA maturation RNase YbeY [Deltaproteobacteria bacterium]|jgi:probable rRNA maturation factor|nr:rRNA maturation RNase YbeY [Deltaproteobacteria bacterium]
MRNIDFVVRAGEKPPRAFLKKWIPILRKELLQAELGARRAKALRDASHISLVFVSAKEIKQLNKVYRRKSRATDVLSFAPTEPGSLGELVFSLSVLKEQAAEHDLTLNMELGYMVLHGILHLLGLDHERSVSEAKRMFRIQDKVFDAVGSRW